MQVESKMIGTAQKETECSCIGVVGCGCHELEFKVAPVVIVNDLFMCLALLW